MASERLLPDFQLANGDGVDRPFPEYLADFNILAIRRVPTPSHGPATRLLRRLLAENRGTADTTVRGFDIRSPDRACESCHGPHIVHAEPDLVTICDGDGSILRKFGVDGYDRFFFVRSGQPVFDMGSLEDIRRSGWRLARDGASWRARIARAPPPRRQAENTSNESRCKTPAMSCIKQMA